MKYIIFLLLSTLISCGANPLFSSLKESSPGETNIQNLENSKFHTWPGNSRLNYAISWKEKPNFGGKSSFIVKFWDKYQTDFFGPYETLDDYFCAFLWMKMPDGNEHGSSPLTITKKTSSYLVDDIYFIMPGQWQLRLRSVEKEEDCNSLKNSPFISEDIISINVK